MTRFIIVSGKRMDIDLPYYVGTLEFSVVPLSMFIYHGNLLIDSKDKSSVMHGIEELSAAKEANDCDIHIIENPPSIIQPKRVHS